MFPAKGAFAGGSAARTLGSRARVVARAAAIPVSAPAGRKCTPGYTLVVTLGSANEPTRVLYDGDCGVCAWLAEREAAHHPQTEIRFEPYQRFGDEELAAWGLTAAACHREVQLVRPGGRVSAGPWAVNRVLLRRFPWSVAVAMLYAVPVLLPLEWLGYRVFARYRHVVSRWLGLEQCRVG
ncbi:MAG: DUF393 domain-containing protein [Myxococcales bacterium FL481]|nr:MAG: DUF393 domain-containing protein [Myxococcales bacterium FL481]